MGLWTHATRRKAIYPELFPEDFGRQLEQFVKFAGLSWEEFAQRLGAEYDRVMEWREGTILTGGEVWHIMRLAWSVPGGIKIMLPKAAEGGGVHDMSHRR